MAHGKMSTHTCRLRGAGITSILAIALATAAGTTSAEDWPQFRGPRRDAVSRETDLLRQWPANGPRVLWSVDVGPGYAGAAIHAGKVYFNDYDTEASAWLLRCVTLADGTELWRFAEKKRIRPNHAITRTVPATDGKHVFSLDPKCVFHCIDARTGKEVWQKQLTREFGVRIPPWYAGQCPLIEEDRVIIAPGGSKALVVALEKATGKVLWATPNAHKAPASHSSVMPAELGGVKQYLQANLRGVVGVSAADGKELWFFPRKFNVAMVPSPVVVPGGRVFVTSCYESGSTMFRVRNVNGTFTAEEVFTLEGGEWNSEVHTPILYKDHLFAVGKRNRGLFTCLDLDGKIVWTSRGKAAFGLGGYVLADGMFYVVEGATGTVRVIEASTTGYKELASAKVLATDEVWAPPALAEGKMVLRDLKKVVCIEVGGKRVTSATP